MQFRKKPVVIDAICWDGGNTQAVMDWAQEMDPRGDKQQIFPVDACPPSRMEDVIRIRTLEGEMDATIGDWIICGVKGELYPCKPDIFEATYEAVE